MNREQLLLDIESPQSGRTLPIAGRPFAVLMAEMAQEAADGSGWTGRLVR